MNTERFLIGAGGHGKVVYDALAKQKNFRIIVWDDDPGKLGKSFLNTVIRAPLSINELPDEGHISIGNNQVRRKIFLKLSNIKRIVSVVDSSAHVSEYCRLGEGSFIASLAILGPQSDIGKGVIVNHGAVIDHDSVIGDFSHIAPNTTIGGGVKIGSSCLIGAGAVVLPGISIGDNITVGAGSVVVKDIEGGHRVLKGIPAK